MSELKMPETNVWIVSARLTRDPELRVTPAGMAIAKLGCVTSRRYKAQEESTFFDATVFGKSAEWVGQHCKKGYPVMIQGRINQSSWQDAQTGQNRSKLECVVDRIQQMSWDNLAGGGAEVQTRSDAVGAAAQNEPEDHGEDLPF
jgi:single-strand DNA-binding protein